MIKRPLKNEGGMALILTILVVALLTITVFDLFHHAWIQSALAAGFRNETKALYAARSGQMAARLILIEDAKKNIPQDTLDEEWAQGTIPIPFDDDEYVFVSIQDQSGKFNLNLLTSDRGYPQQRWIKIFRRLLENLDLDPNLSDAVVDWLDANHEPLPAGAEDGYYASIEKPYSAKNGKLDSVDELFMVKGFTPKVMKKLSPYVTAWSDGKINVNTAPPVLLASLDEDMTEEMARAIVRARAMKPFRNPVDVKRVPGVAEVYPKIALSIGARSSFFSVVSSATFGETTKIVRAVYRRSASGTEKKYYRVF